MMGSARNFLEDKEKVRGRNDTFLTQGVLDSHKETSLVIFKSNNDVFLLSRDSI
jgi:hypothetical protein